MKGYSARIALLCAALTGPFLPSVWSQGAPTPPVTTPPKEEAITLPAFVINETQANPYVSKQALSGTRVAMAIQDIPQTISVVTNEFITDTLAPRMLDAAKYVTPVVESTLPFGGDRYTIRGFQVSHEFIDGMEISGADGYSMSLAPYNIERVEIIKGPNAILVPGGAPGGQFNPITKSPLMKDQSSVTLELSQYIGNAISTDINRVISADKGIAARIVAAYWDSDGYQKNHFRRGYLFAPSLSWQLSPAHKLTIKAEFVDNLETNGTALPIDPNVGSDGYATIARGLPRDWSFGNKDDQRQRNTERITLELLSTLNEHINSRLLLSGNHVLREDQGGTSAAIFFRDGAGNLVAFNPTRNPFTGKYEPGVTWTVDNSGPTAIATSTSTPIPDPSTWVYRRNNGSDHLYYNEAHLRNDYAIKFSGGEAWQSTTITGMAANFSKVKWKSFPAQPRGDVANNNLGAIGYLPYVFPEPSAPTNGQNKTAKQQEVQFFVYETAGFFRDRLLLSGGAARYFGTLTRTDNTGVQPIGDRTFNISTTAKSYGIVAKPIKQVGIFYSYNSSGESMPGSLQAGNPGLLPPFQATNGTQDEYGVKTSFLRDTLTVSFAHFDISQTNYPVPNSEYYTLVAQGNFAAAALLPTSTFLDVNSKGWEIEGSYAVNRNLTVIGNYSKFKYRQPTGVRIRAVPDRLGGIYFDYRFTQGRLNGFGVNLGADYKTDMVGESVTALTTTKPLPGVPTTPGVAAGFVASQATYKYDGRTLINLGFSYRTKAWTARLQIENVTDKDYILAGGSRTAIVVGNPRYAKGSFTYNF
ncbi:MAG TPA: TonB-dependent receptor plug domain-containing protein [Opitutaceae bacterium]|nr:TonB-dependent receptor plug domain-containing protein [Opitutaceae bacterium]